MQLSTLVDSLQREDLPLLHATRKGIGIGVNTHLEIPIDEDVSLYLQVY